MSNVNLETVKEKLQEKMAIKSAPQNANLPEELVEEMARENIFHFFWPFMTVSAVGALLGFVFLGRL